MRLVFLLPLLILLLSTAHAAPQPFPYEKFLPENMSFSDFNFTEGNQTSQVLIVQGNIYAFLQPSKQYQLEPISSLEGIKEALYSYYTSLGYSPASQQELARVHDGIAAVGDARKKGEADCRRLLGSDRTTCDSFEHCLMACYSVTSFCQPVALGAGRPFIESMWQFENDTLALDAAYAAEGAAYQKVSSNATAQSLSGYLVSLQEINRRATKASANQLFYGYSYCFMPDYSMQQLTNLQLVAQRSYANSSRFFELDTAAQRVLNLTTYGFQKLEYLRGLEEQELVMANSSSSNATISRKDSELADKYNSLNPAPFRQGPFNSSQAKEQAQAAPAAAPDEHLSLQLTVLSSLSALLIVAILAFLYLKLRKRRERL